jgi:hypothetical protein
MVPLPLQRIKKIEGAPISSLFPRALIEQNEISISDDGKGNIRVVAPIMGLNAKLGLLIMMYEAGKINIEAACHFSAAFPTWFFRVVPQVQHPIFDFLAYRIQHNQPYPFLFLWSSFLLL